MPSNSPSSYARPCPANAKRSTLMPRRVAVQVITHEMPLTKAAEGYKMFNDKVDGCMKVVLKPWDSEP